MENALLNNILDTDSYKFSHWRQYPTNTTAMFSYLESRGGKYDKTVFFGLQYYLKEYLSRPVNTGHVLEAKEFAQVHGVPFNYDGWRHIVDKHGGYMPVIIRAVPEGTVVPTGNILMSVESTDPKAFWAVSWLETMLVRLWYPITVATQSWHIKQHIKSALELTADNPAAELPFKLHDFGSRGVSSRESAMIGGAAHLVNFQGSDTVAGIWMAQNYYHAPMPAFSIPAAEHSTITMWGRDREAQAYANMLDAYRGAPIIACVSDSYDIHNAVSNIWGGELRDKVRAFGGTVVIRPDSGDPAEIVVETLGRLEAAFGATTNKKGYKVINDNVRVLQGDGIDEQSIKRIMHGVILKGYSLTNVAFGMGGALLQQVNRDTQRFAFKCSWAEVDGKGVDVFKDPVTDNGKRSKKGRLELERRDGVFCTVARPAQNTVMREAYADGHVLVDDDFEDIRARAEVL